MEINLNYKCVHTAFIVIQFENVFENIIFVISTLDYRTQPLKACCYDHFEICDFIQLVNNNIYIYDVFENIIFGISTLDYRTQSLKACCYDHFEICDFIQLVNNNIYIYMMFLKISYSESAHSITAHNL